MNESQIRFADLLLSVVILAALLTATVMLHRRAREMQSQLKTIDAILSVHTFEHHGELPPLVKQDPERPIHIQERN